MCIELGGLPVSTRTFIDLMFFILLIGALIPASRSRLQRFPDGFECLHHRPADPVRQNPPRECRVRAHAGGAEVCTKGSDSKACMDSYSYVVFTSTLASWKQFSNGSKALQQTTTDFGMNFVGQPPAHQTDKQKSTRGAPKG